MSTPVDEKHAELGIERQLTQDDLTQAKNIRNEAINRAKLATEKEHRMSLLEGIRTYPKAIAWSMLISLCIAMEAFDLCLLNTFCELFLDAACQFLC
jgi:DNA-binding Xre family transcriptional regulator